MQKSFFRCLILARIVGQMRQSPCLKLTIFTISTEWDKTPNVSVIHPNSMTYLPVQFYALCPFLSGIILSFTTNCLIMPHSTLKLSHMLFIRRKILEKSQNLVEAQSPFQKQNFGTAAKYYAEADIKGFWSSPISLHFFTLFYKFFPTFEIQYPNVQ